MGMEVVYNFIRAQQEGGATALRHGTQGENRVHTVSHSRGVIPVRLCGGCLGAKKQGIWNWMPM